MKCPRCENEMSVDTTNKADRNKVIRYRRCPLGHRTTTVEITQTIYNSLKENNAPRQTEKP